MAHRDDLTPWGAVALTIALTGWGVGTGFLIIWGDDATLGAGSFFHQHLQSGAVATVICLSILGLIIGAISVSRSSSTAPSIAAMALGVLGFGLAFVMLFAGGFG
jgi:hypothetical protein